MHHGVWCRIASSKVALSKTQLDAVVERISRARGTAEIEAVSVDVDMDASESAVPMTLAGDCAAQVTSASAVPADMIVPSTSVVQCRPGEDTHIERSTLGMHCQCGTVTLLQASVRFVMWPSP